MGKEPVEQSKVEELLSEYHGRFTYRDICDDLRIITPEGKASLRSIMKRILERKDGLMVARDSKKQGAFRIVEDKANEVDWQGAMVKPLKVWLPFGLGDIVNIFPKSIIVVAGDFNAGKTAFLYNVVIMNMENFLVDLYDSEMGRYNIQRRFANFPQPIPNPAPFRTFSRDKDFADVIDPDRISVIDCLGVDEESPYLIGRDLKHIINKLLGGDGVAVIGMQKPKGRDLAFGKDATAQKAMLYIALHATGNNRGRLKIVKAKEPANPDINPNNKQWTFRIENGVTFTDIKEYYPPDDYDM